MGISIVRFQKKNNKTAQFGVLKKNKIVPIAGRYKSLADFLNRGRAKAKAAKKEKGSILLKEVNVLSPITRPCRLMCQGVNYAKHRAEAKADIKTNKKSGETLYFRKDDSSIMGPYDDIVYPEGVKLFDYEVEMGVVMGKSIQTLTEVNEENITEYVAGIVLCQDMTVREWMFSQPYGQWFKSKSHRNSSPMGPVFYLFEKPSEAKVINDLHIRLWLNMEVGDVLLTGTPGGVSLKVPQPVPTNLPDLFKSQEATGVVWMKRGDTVKAELVSADGKVQMGMQEFNIV